MYSPSFPVGVDTFKRSTRTVTLSAKTFFFLKLDPTLLTVNHFGTWCQWIYCSQLTPSIGPKVLSHQIEYEIPMKRVQAKPQPQSARGCWRLLLPKPCQVIRSQTLKCMLLQIQYGRGRHCFFWGFHIIFFQRPLLRLADDGV